MFKAFLPMARICLAVLAAGGFCGEMEAAAAPSFSKDVHGFLKQHCFECHGEKTRKADLDLRLFRDEATLLKNHRGWANIVKMVTAGEMPPKKQPQPTAAERTAFGSAVEAATARLIAAAKPDPGHVTLRRLNRTEYNNTVRDLLFVDFEPAADFPDDDIGHGFDNIGDVLTVSPVLMERYLDAAETIVSRVIVETPPKPASRYLSGRFLQPGNAKTPQGRFRPMDPAAADPTEAGPFAAPGDYLKFSAEDDLIFRASLYAEPRGPAPVKVVLFLQGGDSGEMATPEQLDRLMGAGLAGAKAVRILKEFEITARSASSPQLIEVPVSRAGKINRAGIAVVKPPAPEAPPKLFIEHLSSEGPLETRPAAQIKLLACSPGKSRAEQTREVLIRFLGRAYRRPATPAEVTALSQLVEQRVAAGGKWEEGIQRALAAALCSPKFLFRVELDERPQAREAHPFDEFQMASRLSYFLWSTMPDQELFDLAGKRQLTANLEAQVRRMLKDPKAEALVNRFALQWLQLQRLQTLAPDAKIFASFNDRLRRSMLRETELFIGEILREDRSLLDLIDGPFTYLNEPLARHYGIADTAGNRVGQKRTIPGGRPFVWDEFARVSLSDPERGGILTHASVLTVTSNPTRTSPVKRGKWILEQILGTPPPPPPAAVPALDEQKELTGTLRQRMEQHRKNPGCAGCHRQMDAMGFAFENFDAIGRFRTHDAEGAIDPSGTLPDGRAFQGAAELKTILKEQKELIARNLAEKLLTYALGRGLEYYDTRAVSQIVTRLVQNDFQFSTLAVAIAQSDPFRLRRGTDLAKASEAE
jgi:hypothetical protein